MNCNVCGAEIPAGATNCPVCGAQVSGGQPGFGGQPDFGAQNYGSQAVNQGQNAYSMAGGNTQTTNPFGAMQAPQQNADPFAAQQGGGYDPYNGGYNMGGNSPFPAPAPAAPKKSNTGLLIGIIAGVVVVATAVILCFVFGVFGGKGGNDGTYKFEKMIYGGMEIDNSMLSSYGLDLGEFSIEIKGDKATVVFYGESAEADVKIDGENITFTSSNGKVLSGTIKGGEITISESGGQIVLSK
jgi:hypothetical protein